jgi:ParB-like chromosome segregation protein Spo0J
MGSLESAIDETFLVDVRALPDEALTANIERFSRAINRLNAGLLAQLEVLDRRGAVAAEHGSTGAWLREKLNVSATVAGRQVRLARDLTDVLPETAARLADGDISEAHCRVIASLRRDLKDEAVRAADPHLADAATTHTPHELRPVVR